MDNKAHLAGQLRDAIRDNNWPLVEAVAGELEHPTGHGKSQDHQNDHKHRKHA